MQKQKAKSVAQQKSRDWSETLFLPKTGFPMKAGLPRLEPELLARWEKLGLYQRLRREAKGREKFILHDGPPYANGHVHVGTGLGKILKDVVVRSQQMMGRDANFVPGWDCHGLPIEWKVEEQYRKKGKNKDEAPVIEFRRKCRDFAAHWLDVQREDFKRLGVGADWANPYTTMSFEAEARIAGELMKFAMNGLLYRGSKPVMWSVVERTALAEAEVEYEEVTSPQVWVKFPVKFPKSFFPEGTAVLIWTTTPWTIPGNRAVSFSSMIDYGLYQVTKAPQGNWAKPGDKFILAVKMAADVMKAAKVEAFERWKDKIDDLKLGRLVCSHPLHGQDYEFDVPLLDGDHVTDDVGTGFVHTAPGHGADDYDLYQKNKSVFAEAGIDEVPHTVREDGYYYEHVPLFGGLNPKRVIDDNGKFGDANEAVIQELIKANALLARGRVKHQYPHSWRSKKPVIFRNTPQWFIAMDKRLPGKGPIFPEDEKKNQGELLRRTNTLRHRALAAIAKTRWVPPQGQNRITGMVETRPDWVISRQRAWGVPITVFVHKETGEVIPNARFPNAKELMDRIVAAFKAEGADAWFQTSSSEAAGQDKKQGARARFLTGLVDNPQDWEQVTDTLDVWFDSGSTHAYVLENNPDLAWPASLYLEGSDQHRGWFQSSLLESCGTRGRAPYEAVLTHGFVVDEEGRKLSKSLGNFVELGDVIKQNGAEILRLWAASSDYAEDLRIGPEIIQSSVDAYRKLRNTIRFLLGNLAHHQPQLRVEHAQMPELERVILHRLHELDRLVRQAYNDFDFKRIFRALFEFCAIDLSAVYFDIRKDALYCEPYDSIKRRACLTVLDELFNCLTAWLAPMLCFTMEEAWLSRFPDEKGSIHLRNFPQIPDEWRDDALAEKWRKIRQVRRVVTGALEVERREKRIGSSLEAAPAIHVDDGDLLKAVRDADWAEIAITSQASLHSGAAPREAFRLEDTPGVAIAPHRAQGRKCARSWKISPDVGADPEFPELTPRDAEAVRKFDAMRKS